MDLFLSGMLEKLALHAEGTEPGGHEVMALIAQDAHDFCGEGFIQQCDHRLGFGLVPRCHGAVRNPLARPSPERLHIGQTDDFFDDAFLPCRARRCRSSLYLC